MLGCASSGGCDVDTDCDSGGQEHSSDGFGDDMAGVSNDNAKITKVRMTIATIMASVIVARMELAIPTTKAKTMYQSRHAHDSR